MSTENSPSITNPDEERVEIDEPLDFADFVGGGEGWRLVGMGPTPLPPVPDSLKPNPNLKLRRVRVSLLEFMENPHGD